MSIFSGFATRKLEAKYNHQVINFIMLLQNRILEIMDFSPLSTKSQFIYDLKKVISQMAEMEKSKYLSPKISLIANQLLQRLDHKTTTTQERLETSKITQDSSRNLSARGPRNIRISSTKDKTNRTKLKDRDQNKRSFSLVRESENTIFNLQNLDMQQILKNRPQLPKKMNTLREKRFSRISDIEIIQEFEEEQKQNYQSPKHTAPKPPPVIDPNYFKTHFYLNKKI